MEMLNYKYTVNLDTTRSNCTIDNVQEVKIQRLPDTDKYDALCANGAMASFEICRFLKEYGRAFFFQAADILDAMKKGHEHFLKNDLEKWDEKNLSLFQIAGVSYQHAKCLSPEEASHELTCFYNVELL